MKQVFCFVGSRLSEDQWSIEDSELFHLERVLRLKVGDQVELIDGIGNIANGTIDALEKSKALIKIEQSVHQPSTKFPIIVAVGALRHGALDEVLPGLVELGVDVISVFKTESGEKDRINDKTFERWNRIVVASSKQSKRARFPKISVFGSLAELLDQIGPFESAYFLDELSPSSHQVQLSPAGKATLLIVGSESGLGTNERDLLHAKGIKGLRFGSYIMRATTATIVAATLLQNARTYQKS